MDVDRGVGWLVGEREAGLFPQTRLEDTLKSEQRL